MSILGHRVLRREDPALLTGRATYTDDLVPAGAAHVAFVRSPMAHAELGPVHVEDAVAAEGVLAVVTAADLDLPDQVPFGRPDHPMARPLLAHDRVRFAGEPFAVVVAVDATAAADAAELVWAELEPLPALVDPEAALDAEPLFPGTDSNVCRRLGHRDEPLSLDDCEVVVRLRSVNQRLAACPIEPHVTGPRRGTTTDACCSPSAARACTPYGTSSPASTA